jgi:hypothetical protein
VVVADLSNTASDRLPVLLAAMKATVGVDAEPVLADAGFRSELVFKKHKDSSSELIVALDRRRQAGPADRCPEVPAQRGDVTCPL